MTSYRLIAPESSEEWRTYHGIRRKVLFENRGQFGVYYESHSDEFAQGNHPLLLEYNGALIGVIRIDIADPVAIFRRVAIRDELQRRGHGKAMLSLAEAFSRENGCSLIRSFVNPGAVGFYERCGFAHDGSIPTDPNHIPMSKRLV